MASYYSLIAFVIYMAHGSAPFDAHGLSLVRVLLLYWLGGIAGGTVFGLLVPLVRNRFGAAIVGIVVALPASAAISYAIDSSDLEWGAVIITAVIFGSIGGIAMASVGGPSWAELGDLEDALGKESEPTAEPKRGEWQRIERNRHD